MRERLALLREYLKNRLAFGKNKKTRKGFILTMVALVEVLAISVVSVSAWVETISTITFKAEGAKIDNYVYTNADIVSGGDYSNPIDLNKYFRAAGGVHLASASSADGENIFFPIKNSGESNFPVDSYRCADVNDKNVNYIDFSFNVKVDKTFYANHAEFYLDKAPTITIGGDKVSKNLVRMAITDTDTQNTVVCGSEASTENVVSKVNGDKTSEKVQAFSDFVSSESEPTELFRVKKGSSKTINIKVWLQDDGATTAYAGKTVSINDVKIVAQNKKGNKVCFVDRTVNDETSNWTKDVKFQQGSKDPVQMNFDENSHTYSCNYTPDADDTKVEFTSGSVTWTTNMKSLNSGDSVSYTAYGDHNGNVGYGTWGEVIEISVSSQATEVPPDTGNVLYMVPDKSDANSRVRMPLTNDKEKWVGYIAKEKADDMTFSFTNNGNPCVIPAPNRGNSTLFVVTSAKTGYWAPPATITVTAGTNGAGTALGEPKVSYDGLTNTTISVTPGTKVKLEANPNEGYALKNWVNSDTGAVADGIGSDGYFTPTASGNYNFTADYVESLTFEAYVKTYDGVNLSESIKGGNVSITCGEKTVSSSTTSSSCNLSALKGSTVKYNAVAEEGYTFGGWYDDPKFTGEAVSNNSEYTKSSVDGSITLYARFNINVYDVFAKAQYGTSSPNATGGMVSFDNSEYFDSVKTKVNHNGTATFYAKPVENYAFIGWFDKTTDTEPVVKPENCEYDSKENYYKYETKITDPKTLYARFKALCTVEAKAMYNNVNDATGGTVKVADRAAGKISSKPVMEGENVTVKAIANKGYKFAGWYKDGACKEPYFNEKNEESSKTLNVSKGITLYAKFELGTGNTFYLYDGGLWSVGNAKLAAYVWNYNGSNQKWFEVSKTGYDNYYSFTLDNNQWKHVIFVRYDPNKNLNDFPTKEWDGYVWNKTSDITIDYNNKCYVITTAPNGDGKNGTSSGYWMTYFPGQQNVFREIYVNTESCSSFGDQSAVLAYRFSNGTDDSFNSDCTKVTKDGKTYWKLSIPTDKDTIYLSRAASGGYHDEFNTSIDKDKSKNLFTVSSDFKRGDWSTF